MVTMMTDSEIEKIKQKKIMEMMNTEKNKDAPAGKAIELNDNQFESFIKKKGIVVVDCWAQWCGPCRTMSPIMDQLAKEWKDKGVHIGKINVQQYPRSAAKYGVSSIPNFLVFKDGKYLGNVLGAVGKKPFEELFKKILRGDFDKKEGYA